MAELSLPGYALYSGTKAGIKEFADGYRYELEKNQHLQVVNINSGRKPSCL